MAEGGDNTDEPRRPRRRPTSAPDVHLEEPYRRYSDGVDTRLAQEHDANLAAASPTRHPRMPGASIRSAPPATGRRYRSASISTTLEVQMGQELRRISDDFHQTYQYTSARAIPSRVQRAGSPGPAHASSMPDWRRRGSIVDLLVGYFTSSDEHGVGAVAGSDSDPANNDVFQPRRRAHSELLMASGLMADSFGRQESLLSTDSRASGSPERHVTSHLENAGYDEVDNSRSPNDIVTDDDEEDDDHQVMFHLSTDEQ